MYCLQIRKHRWLPEKLPSTDCGRVVKAHTFLLAYFCLEFAHSQVVGNVDKALLLRSSLLRMLRMMPTP